jgi:hypothetical protein
MDLKKLKGILAGLNNRTLFCVITLFLVINNYFLNEFIFNDGILYDVLDDQLSIDHIATVVYLMNRWKWIGYLLIPIVLLVKIYVISFCIEIGAIFKGYNISIKKIVHVVLLTEPVIVAGQIIRTAVLYFSGSAGINEIQYFYPLSILNLFNSANLESWLIYPLQMINLFVLTYFFVLAYGLSMILRKNFTGMLSFVVSTYGTCLLIWVLLVMLINLSIL